MKKTAKCFEVFQGKLIIIWYDFIAYSSTLCALNNPSFLTSASIAEMHSPVISST